MVNNAKSIKYRKLSRLQVKRAIEESERNSAPANFERCDLQGVDLSGIDFLYSDFRGGLMHEVRH